ncbi:hypothetical protein IGI04_026061 [Brassica rapa subsp. trilocularis]|uniref:Ubiquitin-like protease family profile domain-containing protein n=1 Tax=Brassica rapa subsp. trilocularis TaxID=1813537 RepID=A0ABQ7KUX7_BRACM|nr:hypothetical protein IGI04_026061 [Brassica rapa subsp. trilocularis]
MVSPSSVTPSRRVTRSQSASDREANPKKIPREGKTACRYAVMSTESEVQEPASTNQEEAASTEQDEAASTEPEFIVTTPTFPERLFARNCYPGKPRPNIYSKASIIGSRMWKELFETEDEDVTVPDVLRMLEQPSLPEWKRLPLALIALVDGLLVCGHKLLRVTPAYIEMLEDTGSFLQYPWGRETFVSTLIRLTPPQPSDPSKMDKSLSVMRLRLKQQSTACYGFPLVLQLFAFKAIPSLLEKIPEPNKTTSFLQEPEECDSTNALLNFEDILLVETQREVIVTYSIPDEGGDPKWKKEVIDPRINNLVRRMREEHEFKATDFRGGNSSLPPLKPAEKAEGVGVKKKCQKPSRRFGKAADEPRSSTQAPQRPIRPRRGICKQAKPGNLSDKEQELKEWIRVELKTQLGKLRNEIFDWLHHDRGGSFTVPQNTAAGKTNRDNSHADPIGMEVPKKRRPFSGDGNDEAEIFGSDSKKHKKNNGDGFSDDETMRMHDNPCDGRTPNARFWEKVDSMAGEGPSFSKSANIPEVDVSTPIGPETVSKPAKPTLPEPLEVFSVDYQLFVLVSEVYMNTDLFGQVFRLIYEVYRNTDLFGLGEGGDESPISGLNLLAEEVEKGTRSDNVYKDPQENTCRMLTVWSHPESYVLPPEEQGGKASPTNSEDYKTPPEDDPMTESRTPDVGNSKLSRYLTRSVHPDKRLKKLFQSCKKPKYTPLADLEKAQFQEFQSILREKPAQKFEIVIGIHVSNILPVVGEANKLGQYRVRRHGRNYLSGRCRFVDNFSIAGIISKFAEFEKASDKLGFNWGGLVSFSFTGKTPRRNDKKVLLVDVDRVYAPMMWRKDHWVNKHMAYLLRALPHVLAAFSPPSDSSHPEEDQAFSWVRPDNIYFNERSGDCGPCAVKFLEMHAARYSYEDMGQIDDKKVDIFRQKYAIDTYEEFIGNAKVQNDG